MVDTILKTVGFGTSKTGLSTVGFTLYNDAGTEIAARSTSGVSEIGATGNYFAKISLDQSIDTMILWDTGDASIRYALDLYKSLDYKVREETDKIRIIWNTLQNQSTVFQKIVDGLRALTGGKRDPIEKGLFDELRGPLMDLKKRKSLSRKDISEEITFAMRQFEVNIPKVEFPKLNIPDHSKELLSINQGLAKLKAEIDVIKGVVHDVSARPMPDIKQDVDRINANMKVSINKLPLDLKGIVGAILFEVKKSINMVNDAGERMSQLDKRVDATANAINATNAVLNDMANKLNSINQQLNTNDELLQRLEPVKMMLEMQDMLMRMKNGNGVNNKIKFALGRR